MKLKGHYYEQWIRTFTSVPQKTRVKGIKVHEIVRRLQVELPRQHATRHCVQLLQHACVDTLDY